MNNGSVLLTGGSLGIGAAITARLTEDGYQVIIVDIADPHSSFNGEFHRADLADPVATAAILDRISAAHLLTRVVNNVGIVSPNRLEDVSPSEFENVVNLNARNALQCVQAALPAMRAQKFGRIVSITSRALLGKQLRTAYAASKGALAAMTRTWALELAPAGITVNSVAPGPIGTDAFHRNNPPDSPSTKALVESIPVRRMGLPEDVAHAVSYFLDDRSSFVTGQTLYVCGGVTVGSAP